MDILSSIRRGSANNTQLFLPLQGDSGGPLTEQVPVGGVACEHTVVGVVSFGVGHGYSLCGRLGVYTRVTSYLDWVTGIIAPNSTGQGAYHTTTISTTTGQGDHHTTTISTNTPNDTKKGSYHITTTSIPSNRGQSIYSTTTTSTITGANTTTILGTTPVTDSIVELLKSRS